MRRHLLVWLMGLSLTFSLAFQALYSVHAQPLRHPQQENQSRLIGEIAFTSNRTGKYQIYVMNADGSNLIRVTSDNTSDNFGPYLAPDGKKILYSSGNLTTGGYRFKVIDTNGLHLATISQPGEATAAHPAWSPDSTRLIFGLLKNNSVDFYRINADGTNRIKLDYPRPSSVPQIAWASNSQIILNTSQGLMLANSDATGLKLLVPNFVGSFALNTKLALESGNVVSVEGYMITVDIADASGANVKRQFAIPARTLLFNLYWSPNGQAIGAALRDTAGHDQVTGYYVYLTSGLLFHATDDLRSVWSPDGNFLAYTATDKSGSSQLFVTLTYPGLTPQQLTYGSYNNAQPSWSIGSVTEAVF